MANINPIGLGLPSESVKSLGELYLSLGSTPISRKKISQKRPQQKSQNKITFARNRWYNIPKNENGRKAPTTIHQLPNGRGGFREKALFTNNISNTNRKPTGEKWTPNNAYRKALNLQNELAKNENKTRKIHRIRK
jgi:hypothetical protein